MSAAVLLSVVAPSAPVKGPKVDASASSDAEAFGAALGEAAPTETAPEPALKAKAEAAPEPAAEPASAPEAVLPANDASTPAVVLGAVVAPPPTAPPAPLFGDGAGSKANADAVAPAPSPALEDEAVPVDGVSPAPVPARSDAADAVDAADPSSPQPTSQSGEDGFAPREKPVEILPAAVEAAPAEDRQRKPEPAASEPAKLVTPVASDRAREVANVRSAVVTPLRPAKTAEPAAPSTPEAVPTAEGAEGETANETPAAMASTPSTETTRVRDVIDRALARPSAQASTSVETQGARAESKAPTDAATVNKSPVTAAEPSVAKSPIEISTAVLPPISADDPPVSASSVAPAAPEARPAEAASSSVLSTLSRAAVETTAQIAAQIVRKLEGRSTRFEMALTPDDLGRVDISLDIDADGALHATLAFDNPVAATELRGRADELRRQLIDAGFTVAEDALSFSERDPSAGQGGAFDREADPRNARAFGAASRLTAEADLSIQTPAWISLSLTPAGVDMKV